MGRLILAFKAFFKAFSDPLEAQKFVQGDPKLELENADCSHLQLLAQLQHAGRLIDFLKEDIKGFNDAQIGAAVRKIHEDSAKVLEEVVTIRPVMEEKEGATVRIPVGYDVNQIKVVGKVKGEPPYQGILTHKGWKAHKRSLPKTVRENNRDIICPAEVEVR